MVKVSKNELAGALVALGKLVCRTSPVELYKTIRLQTVGSDLRLTTVGLNESLSVVLDAEADGPLDKIVYFAELKDAVKGSAAGMVTFHEAEGVFSIQVESGRNIIGQQFGIADVVWPEPVKVPADVKPAALPENFVVSLATAAPIVDRNNPRKVLQGVNLSRDGIAVTNGKELWVDQMYLETDPLTIPFPLALLATKEKMGGWLKVWRTAAGETWFRMTLGRWEWTCKALPGEYPHWQRVVPQHSAEAVHVELNGEVLNTIQAYLKRSASEKFLLTPKSAELLEIASPDVETDKVQVPAVITGRYEDQEIALARAIMEHLTAEHQTHLAWSDGCSAMTATGGNGLYVAMPLYHVKATKAAVAETAIEPYKPQNKEETKMNKVENNVVPAPVAQVSVPEVVINPLDDLNSAIEDFRLKIKAMFEESNALSRKVKEVALMQKQKERDFTQAKRAIERIRMAI